MVGIWALCHMKIRGTVMRFDKALWRITSLKKKDAIIVSDCFEVAGQPTSADLRYERDQNIKRGLDFEMGLGSCRVIRTHRHELGAW